MREQFIAMLSHDLRTPLNAILNGTELLRQYVWPAAIPVLDRMRRSGERNEALVDDVSDFTRGRMGGGISLNLRQELNLEHTFSQAIEELRNVYPGRTIIADLPTGIALQCDAARMGQLLSNLLKNAIVHGSDDQPVRVSVVQANGIFQLPVTNAGPAILPEAQEQLFKPFWQAAKHRVNQGLGLGLFIASEIANSHGGTLEVRSTDAVTRFMCRTWSAAFVERRTRARP